MCFLILKIFAVMFAYNPLKRFLLLFEFLNSEKSAYPKKTLIEDSIQFYNRRVWRKWVKENSEKAGLLI